MDQFDFNEPVHAKIIFDESDEEIFETKPFLQDIEIKEVYIDDSLNVKKVQEDIERKTENGVLTPSSDKTKIETIRELTNRIIENNNTAIRKSSHQKSLDMPILEEKTNNKIDNSNIGIQSSNQNKKTKSKNNIKKNKQKTKEMPTENKGISKRRLSKEINNLDKQRKSAKLSTDNNGNCETKDGLMVVNNGKEISKEVDVLTARANNGDVRQNPTESVMNSNVTNGTHDKSPKDLPPIVSQTRNGDGETTHIINIEVNPMAQTSCEDEISQSLKKFNNTISMYLKGLLDTVSEHMIYILNSYQNYCKLRQSNAYPSLIENARNNYIRIRNHFFDLSYSSIVNIIIPRKNDATFITNFITSTMQIGNSNYCNYSYAQIEPLYHNMILWAQHKKLQIQNMNSKSASSVILQEMLTPPTRPPAIHQTQQFRERNEMSSNNSPQYLQIPNQDRQAHPTIVHHLQNPIVTNPPPPYSNQNQQYHEKTAPPNVSPFSEYGNIHHPFLHQQTAHRQHYQNQTFNTYPKQNTSHKLNNNIRQIHGQITKQPYPNSNTDVHRGHQDSTSSWLQAVNSTRPKEATNAWVNDPNFSYAQNYGNSQEITLAQSNQHFQPENNLLETNRSSISRDSGFMSPLNFSTGSETLQQKEQRTEQSMAPLITHVTSLNPNAALITNGFCTICGKITNQKCIGCFKFYYCSHKCQLSDWKIHALVCCK